MWCFYFSAPARSFALENTEHKPCSWQSGWPARHSEKLVTLFSLRNTSLCISQSAAAAAARQTAAVLVNFNEKNLELASIQIVIIIC
jgi:hypothetical protein